MLSAAEHTEFQLPSASEGFGADAVPDDDALRLRPNTSCHPPPRTWARPRRSMRRTVASEYQLPSASDELIPEAEAATGASEFQLPDASSDFGGSALSVGDTSADVQRVSVARRRRPIS